MSGVRAHTSNPCWPLHGLLLKSTAPFFIMITDRADWDSGRSLCTRQLAHSHPTTVEPVCGQGRRCLDKYASVPRRRCSYFHHFVWECKFLCVIPVYYINAPGQNENEYSHVCTCAHPGLILLKSINTDITVPAQMQHAADIATTESGLICCWCTPFFFFFLLLYI